MPAAPQDHVSPLRHELGHRGFPLFLDPAERGRSLLAHSAVAVIALLLWGAAQGYLVHVLEPLSPRRSKPSRRTSTPTS